MLWLAAVLALAALLVQRRNGSRTSEPPADKPPADNPAGSTGAILWAHKTGAGFVAVGYCPKVDRSGEGMIRLRAPTMLHPGFVAAGVEPESPGFFTGPDLYFSQTEIEKVSSKAGMYQVLAPLNFAGFLESDAVGLLMAVDLAALKKLRERYLKERKSFAMGRKWAWPRSELYRVRQAGGPLTAYLFPVLLEV